MIRRLEREFFNEGSLTPTGTDVKEGLKLQHPELDIGRVAALGRRNLIFDEKYSLICVASRPRFGGDSLALSWYRPAEMRPSWIGTSWKGSAGQEPAISDETGARPRIFICL
jgi:hypothetical protein